MSPVYTPRGRGDLSTSGVKFQISGSFGSIWPRLLLAERLEMRPPWPHLAHRWHTAHSWHCASMRPRWPWLASSGVARSGQTFNSVAFGCISLHSCRLRGNGGGEFRSGQPLIQLYLVAFRCFPVVYAGQGFHPHPSLLPSRDFCVTPPGVRLTRDWRCQRC